MAADGEAGFEDAANYVPDTDNPHASLLEGNKTPEAVVNAFWLALDIIQHYGWFILLGLIILYFLWDRILRDMWYRMKEKLEEANTQRHYDPGEVALREQAMMTSREKWQTELDEKANEWNVKKKEVESQKRAEKIEDWDRHRQGRGYRSKLKSQKVGDDSTDANSCKPKSKKRLFKPDYNPLTGSSSGPSYRPSHSSGSQGGGS